MIDLAYFVKESNWIENISVTKPSDIEAHEEFLSKDEIWVDDLTLFVHRVAGAELRLKSGMDVIVGTRRPRDGGLGVGQSLYRMLQFANYNWQIVSPHKLHVEYETLHPFMDGNGRSGRVLWLWLMFQQGQRVVGDSFLRTFYYQTLEVA